MEIIYKKIDELERYENNPRDNVAAIPYVANSIAEFGFKVPIIIDKNNVIIAGHTRLEAAITLGMNEVPCIVADDLSEEQVKAFRLVDNKTSEFSKWDFERLNIELEDIFDIDMEHFGFMDIEMPALDGIPDDVEIEKESSEGEKVSINSLKFCGNEIPMTEEETETLKKLYDEYTDMQGTNYGFVGYLLKKRGA